MKLKNNIKAPNFKLPSTNKKAIAPKQKANINASAPCINFINKEGIFGIPRTKEMKQQLSKFIL